MGRQIELEVPDRFEDLPQDAVSYLERFEAYARLQISLQRDHHDLAVRKSRHRFRNLIAIWLLTLCTVVVAVSLGLVIAQALGRSNLPDNTVHTLVASIAVQIIAMTFVVVRFFFARDQE
jgi:type VI protein secretion system component VasF